MFKWVASQQENATFVTMTRSTSPLALTAHPTIVSGATIRRKAAHYPSPGAFIREEREGDGCGTGFGADDIQHGCVDVGAQTWNGHDLPHRAPTN